MTYIPIKTYLHLTDTPDTYSGFAGQAVAVNETEDGLEYQATISEQVVAGIGRLAMIWPGNTANPLGDGTAETGTTTVAEVDASATDKLHAHGRTVKSTSASTTSSANSRGTGTGYLVAAGTSPDLGGYRLTWKFGMNQTKAGNATMAAFVGLHNSGAAIGNVDPTSLTNIVGFGFDPADTGWFFLHNDGSGSASKVPMGGSFPIDTTTLYEAIIECEAGSTDVSYSLRNMATGATTTGTVSSDVPAAGTRAVPQIWIGNRGTATVSGIVHVFMSLETGMA